MRAFAWVGDFVRLGHRDQLRLVAVWSLLGFTRLAILVLPFRTVRHLLGEDRAVGPGNEPTQAPTQAAAVPPLTAHDRARAERIGQMIVALAARTPWRSECYPQALTARILLGARRIPHRMTFGLRRSEGALVAHVWVHAEDIAVTGGDGRDYTEVGSFQWVPEGRGRTGEGRS
jgi:hypothetical protein